MDLVVQNELVTHCFGAILIATRCPYGRLEAICDLEHRKLKVRAEFFKSSSLVREQLLNLLIIDYVR